MINIFEVQERMIALCENSGLFDDINFYTSSVEKKFNSPYVIIEEENSASMQNFNGSSPILNNHNYTFVVGIDDNRFDDVSFRDIKKQAVKICADFFRTVKPKMQSELSYITTVNNNNPSFNCICTIKKNK